MPRQVMTSAGTRLTILHRNLDSDVKDPAECRRRPLDIVVVVVVELALGPDDHVA